MGVGDEVDPLWLLSGQMTLAVLIMFYIHNIFTSIEVYFSDLYVHQTIDTWWLQIILNTLSITFPMSIESEQGEAGRSVEILNDL